MALALASFRSTTTTLAPSFAIASAAVPSEPAQDDPAAPEDDALLLQPDPLGHHPRHPRATADAALRVDDAMPRNAVGPAHHPPHRARGARLSDERRQLTVGRDTAPRDSRDERQHGRVEFHAVAARVCSS